MKQPWLLFHALQRLDHIDLFQPEIHDSIDNYRENQRQKTAQQITPQTYYPAEHHQIHLYGLDNELVQESAHYRSHQNSDDCQENIFPVDIHRHFGIIKAQHLNRRKLPYPL